MQTDQVTQDSAEAHIYMLSLESLIFLGFISVFCVGFLLFVFVPIWHWGLMSGGMELTVIVNIAVFLIIASFLLGSPIRMRIVLSEQGITYYSVWDHLQTTWDNVERIGTTGIGEALLLRQPVPAHGWLATLLGRKASLIPLTIFGQTWGDSPLAQDLKRYLPHLFTPDNRG